MNTQDVIKKIRKVGGGLAVLSAAGIVFTVARRLKNRWRYQRPFDIKKMVEVKGTVLEVSHSKENKDEKRGVFLILKSNKEEIPVHLGPMWYMSRQHHFKTGDNITVKGSKVDFNDAKVIIASEIHQGKMRMILRDEKGDPVWQSWRKKA